MRKHYSPEKSRAWFVANRESQIVRSQNSRAKRLGAPGTIILADWVQKKARGCVYCGATRFSMHIDHRIPLSRGGTNEPDNIQATCEFCNRAKRDLDEAEFMEWLEAVRIIDTQPKPARFTITFRWEPPKPQFRLGQPAL